MIREVKLTPFRQTKIRKIKVVFGIEGLEKPPSLNSKSHYTQFAYPEGNAGERSERWRAFKKQSFDDKPRVQLAPRNGRRFSGMRNVTAPRLSPFKGPLLLLSGFLLDPSRQVR